MDSHGALARRTFDVVELLEAILSILDMKDLLTARAVCKHWRSNIDGSVTLRRALFLNPETPAWIWALQDQGQKGHIAKRIPAAKTQDGPGHRPTDFTPRKTVSGRLNQLLFRQISHQTAFPRSDKFSHRVADLSLIHI